MMRKLAMLALPLVAACAGSANAGEAEAVDQAVLALYAPYSEVSPDWDEVRERPVYTRATAALVKRWEAGIDQEEVEDLADFDWLCQCQDWDQAAFKVELEPHGEPGGAIDVTAKVDPGWGEFRPTRFTMVKEDGAWRVQDIVSESFPDGLVKALEQAIADRRKG